MENVEFPHWNDVCDACNDVKLPRQDEIDEATPFGVDEKLSIFSEFYSGDIPDGLSYEDWCKANNPSDYVDDRNGLMDVDRIAMDYMREFYASDECMAKINRIADGFLEQIKEMN